MPQLTGAYDIEVLMQCTLPVIGEVRDEALALFEGVDERQGYQSIRRKRGNSDATDPDSSSLILIAAGAGIIPGQD